MSQNQKIEERNFLDFFSFSLVQMIRNNPLDFQNSENWFLVHSRWLKLGYGPKIGQKWAINGYFQNFKKSIKNHRYCLKETWNVLYWAKMPAESKKLDKTCPEPFGGKYGGLSFAVPHSGKTKCWLVESWTAQWTYEYAKSLLGTHYT